MAIISWDNYKPRPLPDGNCICCQINPGKHKYGIRVCPECDQRIFIKPYAGFDIDRPISAISLRADHTNTPYDELTVIYRFKDWDTLISARKGTLSFPLLTIPGIQLMTEEWLTKLPSRLPILILFS